MIKSRFRATMLAAGLALTALLIGGYQEAWRVNGQYTPEEMADGRTKPFYRNVRLWTYLAKLPEGGAWGGKWEARNPYRNQIHLGIVVGVAGGIGLLAFWIAAPRRRPEPAADYAETRGQSVRDGRDSPPDI